MKGEKMKKIALQKCGMQDQGAGMHKERLFVSHKVSG